MDNKTPWFLGIGALGGSGTRVLASIIQGLDISIGKVLNDSLDNLEFTRLFKRPNWGSNASKEDIKSCFEIFKNLQLGLELNIEQEALYKKIKKENSLAPPFDPNPHISVRNKDFSNINWAWKEPNTHFYIKQIKELYPEFKYIHLVRHGLDMAFSDNVQQLINWNNNNLDLKKLKKDKVYRKNKQLDFWIEQTKKINSLASDHFNNDILILRYTDLLEQSEIEIQKLSDFLKIPIDSDKSKSLQSLIIKPKTHLRYHTEDLTIFSQKQLDDVEELGFKIN